MKLSFSFSSVSLALTLGALTALAGCSSTQQTTKATGDQAAQSALSQSGFEGATSGIDAAEFAERIKILASDEFAGRGPGTVGETKTVEYLVSQFKAMGLKPGNNGSWTQTVPMTSTRASLDSVVDFTLPSGKTVQRKQGDGLVITSRTGKPSVSIDGSEMVFIGYGVDAPEANWNDYDNQDWTGKTVVMLVNDPGFHVGDKELFGGERMTYYGRWTYKYDEAAKKGAKAALIIHDTKGAGYGWDVVHNSWMGDEFGLPSHVDPSPRLTLQGWLDGDLAETLFTEAGLNLAELRQAANKRGFKPVPMNTKLSTTHTSTSKQSTSDNVLAMIEGSEKHDEVVVYMAHWDHLGDHGDGHAGEGHLDEDTIYNGAVDNATGVAGIMEIAQAFVNRGVQPKRSILFMAVTLEEGGLIGSKYYVAKPVFPMNKTVGVINLDAMPLIGKTRDISVVGLGSSEMEDILKPIAAKQNRVLVGELNVAAGFYYRSDHFNFAKAGVPALYCRSGFDTVAHGRDWGLKKQQDYVVNDYHKPSDEWKDDMDVSGAIEDLEAMYAVGKVLVDGDSWPNWYQGNEFKAIRDASRK